MHAGAWTMTWAESFRGLRMGGTEETRREKMRPRVQRSLKDGIVPLVLVSLNEISLETCTYVSQVDLQVVTSCPVPRLDRSTPLEKGSGSRDLLLGIRPSSKI